MLVDKYARQRCHEPQYELETFYGQLQHVFIINFPDVCDSLDLTEPTTIILVAIRSCVLDPIDPLISGILDIHTYTKEGPLHYLDVTGIQCLVAQVKDGNKWYIFDRSGALARALYLEDEED
jgi:hypothetical protein